MIGKKSFVIAIHFITCPIHAAGWMVECDALGYFHVVLPRTCAGTKNSLL